MGEKMRLDRYLANMNLGTRSEVREYIKKGRVKVNNKLQKKADTKIDVETDVVEAAGKKVEYSRYEYYMLYKPQGVVSATEDKREKTVLDLFGEKSRKDLFPAGRLDKDTEGLLLITNDGELAHQLLSPKKHVEKTYIAKIQGRADREDIRCFQEGIDIGEERKTLPAALKILEEGEKSIVEVRIVEGKFHQIKRMFASLRKPVLYLKRVAMGTLCLDESLNPGEYRSLTKEEISALKGDERDARQN